MAELQEFTFRSSNGKTDIYVREWIPAETPRAVVQLVHGISEHIIRYDDFARFLAENGFVAVGNDHLGHGKTAMADSRFGFFDKHDGWTLATADVRELRRLEGEKYPGVPYFLFGHSMGSFLTRTFLCRYAGEVDGAILSGTGQEAPALVGAGKLVASVIARFRGPEYASEFVNSMALGAYNKQFAPSRTPVDWLSRDEAVVDAYVADPLCGFTPSVGLYRDMFTGLQYIASEKALSQMNPDTPVFLLSGDHDPVGSNGAGVRKVYDFFRKHGTRDLSIKLYEGGRHEMLNEICRREVYGDILSWLTAHLEPADAPAGT